MSHSHSHDHSHTVSAGVNVKAYWIGIALNWLFILIEVVVGIWINSLALLTDAGHNFSDIIGLVLSLVALSLARRKPSPKYTYGYKRSTILAALFNSIILLLAVGGIAWEAFGRIKHPYEVEGGPIAIVAVVGILVNGFTALLFMRDKEMNSRAAFLHMLSDALVSFGVVISGVVIFYTHWYWVDAVVSLAIVMVILSGTWKILRDSLRLSMDAVPENLNLEEIEAKLSAIEGVKKAHHTHIWALSTTETALTTHLILKKDATLPEVIAIKEEARHRLHHLNIVHATIEIESEHEAEDWTGDTCH